MGLNCLHAYRHRRLNTNNVQTGKLPGSFGVGLVSDAQAYTQHYRHAALFHFIAPSPGQNGRSNCRQFVFLKLSRLSANSMISPHSSYEAWLEGALTAEYRPFGRIDSIGRSP